MARLSENIKKYRKKLNLTQTELAEKLYVTKQAVSKWETGRSYPDASLLPEIAKVLGISIDLLMGKKFFDRKRIILLSMLSAFLLLIIGFTPLIVNHIKDKQAYDAFTLNLEHELSITFPNHESLSYTSYEPWAQYGNVMIVSHMSYLVFDRDDEIEPFESALERDTRWVYPLSDDASPYIPLSLHNYKDLGDYFLIYDVKHQTYHDFRDTEEQQEYIFLIYQIEHHRLIVFDYFI